MIFLAFLFSAAQARPQRITVCDCDGSLNQAWSYPVPGQVGVVGHLADARCWGVVAEDGCAWGGSANHSCIGLLDSADCGNGAGALFNVTAGFSPGTVIFSLASIPSLCVDWYGALAILELYPCYGTENRQQCVSQTRGRARRYEFTTPLPPFAISTQGVD